MRALRVVREGHPRAEATQCQTTLDRDVRTRRVAALADRAGGGGADHPLERAAHRARRGVGRGRENRRARSGVLAGGETRRDSQQCDEAFHAFLHRKVKGSAARSRRPRARVAIHVPSESLRAVLVYSMRCGCGATGPSLIRSHWAFGFATLRTGALPGGRFAHLRVTRSKRWDFTRG